MNRPYSYAFYEIMNLTEDKIKSLNIQKRGV